MTDWQRIFENIRKSVVLVDIISNESIIENGQIVTKQRSIGHGTGFMLTHGTISRIITANHVIDPLGKNQQILIYAINKSNKKEALRNITIDSQDKEIDIAILNPNQGMENFDPCILPNEALSGKFLKIGVEVVWCGYPSVFPKRIPILQRGMIAGYSDQLTTKGNVYIVDGMVNPGNSGSPVFYNYKNEVIGLVTAYAPQPSFTIIDQSGHKLDLSNPSGLALVIPINYMLEMLEKLK